MRKPREIMTPQDHKTIWQGWHVGRSLSDLGRDVDKAPASIFGYLRQYGGIEPAIPTRSERTLSLSEREEISRGIVSGLSFRAIADGLGRSPSTVSREVNRNGGCRHYRAIKSDNAAWKRAKRPKECALSLRASLCEAVSEKLGKRWSPQQVSGWLKREYPDDETMRVSHETIYKTLYIQSRGVLKRELQALLRRKRKFRQSRLTNKGCDRGSIIDAVPISERPPEVDDRAIPGHWEGDLISGSMNSHIATLVERQTRFVMLVKVDGKDTQTVVDALIRQVNQLPEMLQKTLTWDRGSELADYDRFSMATDMEVYFCDPSSPWQRGSNENTNGLLRQYFPKGMRLDEYSQDELNEVAMELNTRPRKTLGYRTPLDCILQVLQ